MQSKLQACLTLRKKYFEGIINMKANNNIKIHVPTPEISEMVQKKLFKEGYTWDGQGNRDVCLRDKPYLFIRVREISWGDSEEYFNNHKNKEITWQEYLFGEGEYSEYLDSDVIYYKHAKGTVWVYEGVLQNYSAFIDEEATMGRLLYKCGKDGNEITKENRAMNRCFTKSDLEVGMGVELRDGTVALIFMGDGEVIFKELEGGAYDYLYDYRDDLVHRDTSEEGWDIVKVFQFMPASWAVQEILWERQDTPQEMTLKEICKELGRDVVVTK